MEKSPEAFRTISEVAEWLDVPTHVLRFWESRFAQVKPVKRAGGRRYYRPTDMQLIGGIKKLLHEDGMTIRGAQKLLREEGVKYVAALSQPLEASSADVISFDTKDRPTPKPEAAPEPAAPPPERAPEAAEETATAIQFGSSRNDVSELPFLSQSGPKEAEPKEFERELDPEIAAEADAHPQTPPARPIPETPDVPDADPEDSDPAYSAGPALASRLLTMRPASLAAHRPTLANIQADLAALRARIG